MTSEELRHHPGGVDHPVGHARKRHTGHAHGRRQVGSACQIAAGKPVTTKETKAYGCSVKYGSAG